MRNDGLQPLALLALYHLANLRAPARKSKGVGADSYWGHVHLDCVGHCNLRGIHRLDFAIGVNPAPNRVCSRGDFVSRANRDRPLEITMIILLIAAWLLVAASAAILVLAWIAEAIDAVSSGAKKN